MLKETVIAVMFHDDLEDLRTYELVVCGQGIVELRTYEEDQLVCSVNSLGGEFFAREVQETLSDPSINIVFNGNRTAPDPSAN